MKSLIIHAIAITGLSFLLGNTSQGQILEIHFKEISFTLSEINHPQDYGEVVGHKLRNDDSLALRLDNAMGKSEFWIYDSTGLLIKHGYYRSSLGILSQYGYTEDLLTGNLKVSLFGYYQPIPTDIWVTYDMFGKIEMQEDYAKILK